MSQERKYDIEERLIEFAVRILDIVEALPNNKAGNHLGGQLVRSGTSPALNYGEAGHAESKNDFIHKMGIALKELRETRNNLKIIQRKPLIEPTSRLDEILKEVEELIKIFAKSIDTARKSNQKK